MANELFKAKILAELDTSQFDQKMNGLLNQQRPIKLTLDIASFDRQLTNIEQRLQNLANMNINPFGGGNGGGGGGGGNRGGQRQADAYANSFSRLLKITNELNRANEKLPALRQNGNAQQIAALNTRIAELRTLQATVQQSIRGGLNADQTTRMGDIANTSAAKIAELGAKVSDTANRMQNDLNNAINNSLASGEIDNAIAKVYSEYEKLSTTGHASLSVIQTDILELYRLQSDMNDSAQAANLSTNYERYEQVLNRVKNTLSTVAIESKSMATALQASTSTNKMVQWLQNNNRAAKDYGDAIQGIIDRIKEMSSNGTLSTAQLKVLNDEFKQITINAEAAGKTGTSLGKSLMDSFKNIVGVVDVTQVIRKGVQLLKEMSKEVLAVDTSMTGLRRVTNLTEAQYGQMYSEMVSSAKEYGATLTDIIDGTTSWVKLGFSPNDAQELAEITAMYQHVTDLDVQTATKNLVTAYKGFEKTLLEQSGGDVSAAVNRIADIYDKLGNEFAESAADVGDGLSKSAAVLQEGGASIEEAAGMFTGINEVMQNSSVSGQALKIYTLRIRGMKGKLEELGEEVDDNVDSISKIQTQILNLTHGKVNIFDDDGNFKNIYDITKEIATIYYDLSDTERASLLEIIAGKNRSAAIAALIQNFAQVEKATEAAYNAAGTASAEQEKYMASLQGKIDSFKASWQALANTVISSDFLKGLVDSGTSLIGQLDKIISKVGALPALLTVISGILGLKSGAGELINQFQSKLYYGEYAREAFN